MKMMPFFKILRPANMLMLAVGVLCGFWLSHCNHLPDLILLIFSAACCAGFGNVVNDLADIETDRISHPNRPLPKKEISKSSAVVYSAALACAALVCGFSVSWQHGVGVIIPLCLLWLYAAFFKGTRLIGNSIISLLVAYGIIFGGLSGSGLHLLYVPAFLAFTLNISREIIKDIQDLRGDTAAGYATTAVLPARVLRIIIAACGVIYALFVFVPYLTGGFGAAYALCCLFLVVPLHVYWTVIFYKSDWQMSASRISGVIKYEMIAGLFALACDEIIRTGMFRMP
jgi:geranylgeranylglycerol-phosphate geranylgeranyltransferase